MTPRERLISAVNHQTSDRIPVDFGATSVTGIHVLAVERLRAYYGLENRPVRVVDPYQMLGEIDQELVEIIGIDTVGAKGKNNAFGFYNHAPYKEYVTNWGQTVLVPENFNTTTNQNNDVLMYLQGDLEATPSGRMPENGYFFDAIIRQQPIKEEELDPIDNLEEYGLVSESDLVYWKDTLQKARATGRAVVAGPGGTALGDIAHVPGIKLKTPKGIRDITEWYLSIIVRPDYIRSIFERQVELALENLNRFNERMGDKI